MSVDDVVSQVGLWWPAAEEDALREAAAAWERTAVALEQTLEVGRSGAAKARAQWSGQAAEAFEQTWRSREQALRDDAAGCRALAGASKAVLRSIDEAEKQLRRWGGGDVLVDGRAVGLSRESAEQGLSRAIGHARVNGKGLPDEIRIVARDGTNLVHPPR